MLNIGLLDPTNGAWTDCIKAFMDQLGKHGWKKGTDYTIQVQAPNGQTLAQAATNLVSLGKPNPTDFIILTGGTEPTCACIQATVSVPQIKVFFATAGEKGAYFTGLANNVTGISNEQTLHVKDRLQHMKTYVAPLLAPTPFTVFGVIGNADARNVQHEINEVVKRAPVFNLRPVQSDTKLYTAADIPTVIQEVRAKGAQALYVCTDPLITTNAATINQAGLPTMHAFRKNLGGSGSNRLLFRGPKLVDMFSKAADLVYNWRTTGVFPAPTTPTGPHEHQP
jgi:putative ABC transport system substrate-binding protein